MIYDASASFLFFYVYRKTIKREISADNREMNEGGRDDAHFSVAMRNTFPSSLTVVANVINHHYGGRQRRLIKTAARSCSFASGQAA
jgi:hypothetical protein